jgi:hypothetical protein
MLLQVYAAISRLRFAPLPRFPLGTSLALVYWLETANTS